MYLSTLLIDMGRDPDRPRPGRQWLRNLYRVHQRLCMAFPSSERKNDDPHFLKPFVPGDFADKQVHIERARDAGFLFRVDPQPGGRVVILVQSAIEPEWDYAFHNAGHLLAAAPEVKSFNPSFREGQRLRFRLMANPTRRLSPRSVGADGQPVRSGVGKRVPVPPVRLHEWLAGRAKSAGFAVGNDALSIQPGYVYVNKNCSGQGHCLHSVRYEGVLMVNDPARFKEALIAGIGTAKAFGFGLLSVAALPDGHAEDGA